MCNNDVYTRDELNSISFLQQDDNIYYHESQSLPLSEASRKLVTIQKIDRLQPIEGCDNIELAKVLGWQCIVKKGEFEEGQFCKYFEIDSFLPIKEEYEFLRKSSFKSTKNLGDGFRIKTIKMRNQISQGLVLPLSLDETPCISNDELVGYDLTELLSVQKYEKPIPSNLIGKVRGNFPIFIPKTDQERIQNIYNKYKYKYVDMTFEATLKMDGSSLTVYKNNDDYGVCSRNMNLIETEDNVFWQVTRKEDLLESLQTYGRNIALQLELCGPGINGNKDKFDTHRTYLFDVWDIDEQRYLSSEERFRVFIDLSFRGAEFKHVPVIDLGINILEKSLEEILEYVNLPNINNNGPAEGVVFKSLENPSITFKAINNEFLLKNGE